MSRRLLGSLVAAGLLSLALTLPAHAQDTAAGGAGCPLTGEEVAEVLGGPATPPMEMQGTCTWMTGTGTVIVGVLDGMGFEMQQSLYPGGVDLTVGEHVAYYSPDANQIWVDLDGRQLFIALVVGNAKDPQRLITRLAEAAVPRVPAREAPAAGSLAAMFPTEIGGQTVLVTQMAADQVATMMGADAGVRERIEATLAGMGKTMADLEVAFGRTTSGQLVAYRVEGADAGVLLPLFVDAFLVGNPTGETSVEPIAGKDVTVASVGGQTIAHLYPSGDILWTVIAVEPGLSEILTELP